VIGNVEVLNRTWWDRATTGLDAAGTIQQQHMMPTASQIVRCSCACGASAYYDDVVNLFHDALLVMSFS
jgi:hypothetical protein